VPTTDDDKDEDKDDGSQDTSQPLQAIRQVEKHQVDARPEQQDGYVSVDGDTRMDDDTLETPLTGSTLEPSVGSLYLAASLHAETLPADNPDLSPSLLPSHLSTPGSAHELDHILISGETEKLLTHCKLPRVCN
jgi:hypothetical protein